jgi:two-component system, chemotaxis family, response regulator Rcp1
MTGGTLLAGGFGLSPPQRNPASAFRSPQQLEHLGHPEKQRIHVLLAEDNPGDVYLVREALEFHKINAQLTVRSDGEEMLKHLEQIEANRAPCPDIILLDLNLPKHSGESVLKHMRQQGLCVGVPVLIITSSDHSRDREATTRLGVNGYFRKPPDFDEFLELGAIVRRIVEDKIV